MLRNGEYGQSVANGELQRMVQASQGLLTCLFTHRLASTPAC